MGYCFWRQWGRSDSRYSNWLYILGLQVQVMYPSGVTSYTCSVTKTNHILLLLNLKYPFWICYSYYLHTKRSYRLLQCHASCMRHAYTWHLNLTWMHMQADLPSKLSAHTYSVNLIHRPIMETHTLQSHSQYDAHWLSENCRPLYLDDSWWVSLYECLTDSFGTNFTYFGSLKWSCWPWEVCT